jgi:hypothetical protein
MYLQFKDIYNDMNIVFSRFAYLHPKHCIITMARGTNNIYMYTVHQHAKTMLED